MSLGNDLTKIRKEKNLSLEDIFEVTKIPVHTLQSIENDTLLSSSTESKTYLRSFVRSYAKALKISDANILAALKATEDNTYNSTLIKLVYPDVDSSEYDIDEQNDSDTETVTTDSNDKENKKIENKKKEIPKPSIDNINWADMSKKVYASPTNSKFGLLMIGAIVIVLVAVSYFYGGGIIDMFSSEDVTEEPVTNNDNEQKITSEDLFSSSDDSTYTSNENDFTEAPMVVNTPETSVLPETLTVTLYAAYEKLEPVRVTSDFNNRTNPFWMNKGDAYYFDFKDSLLVRGQYARFLLMYNGNLINNPRQNHFDPDLNSIVITRDILSSPEYQVNNVNNFPLNLGVESPDSIIYRLEF